jgi:hypothetical protein
MKVVMTSSKYLEKSGHYSRGLFMFNTRYYQASDFATLESQLNYVLKLGIIKIGLNMTHNKVLYN